MTYAESTALRRCAGSPPRSVGRTSTLLILWAMTCSAAQAAITLRLEHAVQVGGTPHSVAIGDVTADGIPDIVVANLGADTLSILRQEVDGEYASRATVETCAGPVSVALGDMDGEDGLDLVVACRDADLIQVFLADGSGGFRAAASYQVGDQPLAHLLVDIDQDGYLDVVVAEGGVMSVAVLTGSSTGRLAARRGFAVGYFPSSLAARDLDDDGFPDVLIGTFAGRFSTWYGDERQLLTGRQDTEIELKGINAIAIVDLENDRRYDVVAVAAVDDAQNQMIVLEGDGRGSFDADSATNYFLPSLVTNLVVTDLNLDGAEDVVGTGGTAGLISVFEGTGEGALRPRVDFYAVEYLRGLAVGQLDQGSSLDVVTLGSESNAAYVFLGAERTRYEAAVARVAPAGPSGVVLDDIDGDGFADALLAAASPGRWSILRGRKDRDSALASRTDTSTGGEPRALLARDFDEDGHPDVVIADAAADRLLVYPGQGGEIFGSPYVVGTGSAPAALVAGDLDGDGDVDVATADLLGASVTMLRNTGGRLEAWRTIGLAGVPEALAVGDLDGDGLDDLAVLCRGERVVRLLLGRVGGSESLVRELELSGAPSAIAVAPMDGDALDDIVVMDASNSRLRVFSQVAGSGGGFTEFGAWSALATVSAIDLHDLNNDGVRDIITLDASEDLVTLRYGTSDRSWASAAEIGVGRIPVAIDVGDVDGDGSADLVTANRGDGSLSVIFAEENEAPVASDARFSVDRDSLPKKGTLDATDPEADQLRFRIVMAPENGTVVLTDAVAGRFEYRPRSGFAGTDRFSFAVSDGSLDSNVATVTLDVEEEGGVGPLEPWWLALFLVLGRYWPRSGTGGDGREIRLRHGISPWSLLVLVTLSTVPLATDAAVVLRSGAELPVGLEPSAIAAGDFDRDGLSDLAVANERSNSVSVLLQKSDDRGEFHVRTDLATAQGPVAIVAVDLDQDARVDLAILGAEDGVLEIWLGDGAGGFSRLLEERVGTKAALARAGDTDGDGRPEVIVASSESTTVHVFELQADGLALARRSVGVGVAAKDLAVQDLNGDGLDDLVVGAAGKRLVSLLSSGGAALSSRHSLTTKYSIDAVSSADVDGDGDLDVVVLSTDDSALEILLNPGSGELRSDDVIVGTVVDPTTFCLADLDADGAPDALTSGRSGGGLEVNRGTGLGRFQASESLQQNPGAAQALLCAALDGDSRIDVVVLPTSRSVAQLYWGSGVLRFEAQRAFPVGAGPTSLAVGDFDEDGTDDAVVVAASDAELSISFGSTNRVSAGSTVRTIDVGGNPGAIDVADLDADGHIDVIIADEDSASLLVFKGSGTDVVRRTDVLVTDPGPADVLARDVTGDGRPDLLGVSFTTGRLTVLEAITGGYRSLGGQVIGDRPNALAASDLDGDGDQDLAVTLFGEDRVAVLFNDGAGSFTPHSKQIVGSQPVDVVATDLDQDGDVDLAVVGFGADRLDLLFGTSSGQAWESRGFAVGAAPRAVAVGDLDGDGWVELVSANSGDGSVSVLLGAAGGDWPLEVRLDVGGSPHDVAIGDFDADGQPDLLVADQEQGRLVVYLAKEIEAPVASDVTYELDRAGDSELQGYLIATSSAGLPLSYSLARQPLNGSVELLDPVAGLFRYAPRDGFKGTDTFTYIASDGERESNVATISVDVKRGEQSGGLGAGDPASLLVVGLFLLLVARARRRCAPSMA